MEMVSAIVVPSVAVKREAIVAHLDSRRILLLLRVDVQRTVAPGATVFMTVICCPACMVSIRFSTMPNAAIRFAMATASKCNGCTMLLKAG